MAALWIYGMTQGVETAAAIAQASRGRDDFRWLAGGLCPSDQTLLNLVGGAPAGLSSIWGQVLEAMHRAGHIDLSALLGATARAELFDYIEAFYNGQRAGTSPGRTGTLTQVPTKLGQVHVRRQRVLARRDAAGNATLMTPELMTTLCEHAVGNYRVLTTMAADILAVAAQRELAQLDDKLYLEVFAPPRPAAPAKSRRLAAEPQR